MSIVLHALVVYLLLMLVLRIMGKRELAEMSAFDMVILFLIGDLIAEAVVSEDTSVTGAFVVVSVFALLTIALSWLSFRSRRLEHFVDGSPTIIVRDGEPDFGAMKRERVSLDDLNEAARSNGIRRLADIELAVLEPNGQFSFFSA